ncbi:MAG: outer membrane beta-barrel protein [Flavobacteriaceae bacterium]
MKNLLYYLTAFLFVQFSNAQQITIKGTISDAETDLPIESATVYLSRVQDSTVVDYTISDKNGNFNLSVRKTDKPTRLKISNVIYQNYSKDFESISENIDLGKIALELQSTMLETVEVVGEVPPIRIKNDTLEFNASSFKVRPDANVESLLKQLPGVEVTSDGTIKVNGKTVSQVLVNGKPFFGEDGKMAVENLPADLINKVQVTDKKTKEQEISGEASTTDDLSINLTIDEEKNKGYFGRVMAGYGTDERYEGSGLINYFKGDLRVSVMLSSNNINASGFSMDEIFDNMRSIQTISRNASGGMSVNGINFGGMGTGITQTNVAGFNYADKWLEKADVNGSYFYSDASTENQNKTKRVNLLPDNLFTTESQSTSKSDNANHNLNLGFEVKIDSTATLWISPSLSKTLTKSRGDSFQNSVDESGNMLNQSNSENYVENDNLSFSNNIYYFKRLKKKGRNFSLNFTNSNSGSTSENYTNSATYFYQSDQEDDLRNQIGHSENKFDSYTFRASYKEPLTDSLSLSITGRYGISKTSDTRQVFDFDNLTQDFTSQNDLLSNSVWSETQNFNPGLRLESRRKKYDFDLNIGTTIYNFQPSSLYLSEKTVLDKNYVVPNLSGNIRYKMTKSKSLSVRYNYEQTLPSASQLLPVENLANPLNTITGNPDLDLNKNHSMSLSFNNYDYATQSGFSTWFSSNYYDSRIASISTYDQDRKQTTTYTNVDDTYRVSLSLNWNKSYKTESGHKFGYGLYMWGNYNLNKGFTNAELFQAQAKSISPSLDLTYEYGEIVSITPSYSFSYSQTDYTNYFIDSSSNFTHTIGMETTSYYPENWTFGNDVGYTYNSNIAEGFRKDFLLWNVSLAYTFAGKKWTAKVKVYDLLNQNTSNSRSITDIAITDTENTILKRYVMFSLSYKLQNFSGKDPKEERRGRRVRFMRW